MASSSLTSSYRKSYKYDVYLSFRGEDVRKNFIAHLYAALQRQGIRTFKDDVKVRRESYVEDDHLKAIEDSIMSIIVFSKNYASSSWCLNELVEIMECHKKNELTVYPVFYDVDPREVRKQTGAFGEAFARHKKEEAGKWRHALKEASDLSGFDLKSSANGDEAKLIETIIENISSKLPSTNLTIDDENLIGMETRIKDVKPALKIGFTDVRMIGIKGLGGGGKTSLARAIYDSLSIQFQGKSFVDNVREVSQGSLTGLKSLQEKILSDLLNDQGINVSSVRDGKKMMKGRLWGRKNLIVLDDVNHIDQLKALAGEPDWFGAGSRIIITTRDEHLLVSYGIERIHNVNLLLDKEAIHLFSRHAFRGEIPTQGFEELAKEVVSYAAGIPLIIEVLGSTLRGMKEFEWKDALERLKTIPLKEMLENLESSYGSLEDDYKEIFLDVACFLNGKPKDDAIRILESCGFHARHGLRVLEQNSLITISEYGLLGMHDRIQDIGKYLVRSLHPNDPKKHSRLWKLEEIESIVAYDLGTEATKAIAVECPVKLCSEIVTKGFGSMKELKILCMASEIVDDRDVKNNEISMSLPNELRFLSWVGYPHWSLPKTFQANNLVALEMPYSRIKCLWEGEERKVLAKLKFIDLSHTKLRTIDLGLIPNIETVNLTECHDLVELHMSVRCLKLRSLKISHSKLTTLDLGMTPNLELLELKNCHDFKELQMPLECLMLRFLDISHSKLSTFNIGLTPNLEKLTLKECHDLIELHIPIECPKLTSLKLRRSKMSIFDLRLTPNLEKLRLEECHELVELHMPIECLKLRSLNLGHSKLRALDLGLTPNLEMLDLQDCYHLAELHTPIGCLKNLVFLNLSGCSKLNSFLFIKQLKSLEVLCLTRLYLKEFPDVIPMHHHESLLEFRFRYNDIYELPSSIENLQQLVYLDLHSCRKLKVLPGSICSLRNLRNLKLYGCSLEELPEDIGQLECLEKLNLSFTSMKHLPDSICMLKNLKTLNLSSCWNLEKLPEDIGLLECLENLILTECTQLRDVPDSICMLKELKYLSFLDCIQIQKLPEELGNLQRLEELNINGTRIRFLPPSISLLTELKICGPKSQTTMLHKSKILRELQKLKENINSQNKEPV